MDADGRQGAAQGRVFAALAAVSAAGGLVLWVAMWLGGGRVEPAGATAHALAMMRGFAVAAALAVLLPALARGGRPVARPAAALAVLLAAGTALALAGLETPARAVHALAAAVLSAIALPRLPRPPAALLALAGATALAGDAATLLAECGRAPAWAFAAGNRLAWQGTALVLACAAAGPAPGAVGRAVIGTLLIAVSAPVEAGPWLAGAAAPTAWALRAVGFACVTLPAWRTMSRSVRWCVGLILVGLVLCALDPQRHLAWQHLAWAGGLVWLALCGLAEVGGWPSRRVVATALTLVLLGAATRVSTGIWSGAYEMHLGMAAILTIAGIGLWWAAPHRRHGG